MKKSAGTSWDLWFLTFIRQADEMKRGSTFRSSARSEWNADRYRRHYEADLTPREALEREAPTI